MHVAIWTGRVLDPRACEWKCLMASQDVVAVAVVAEAVVVFAEEMIPEIVADGRHREDHTEKDPGILKVTTVIRVNCGRPFFRSIFELT